MRASDARFERQPRKHDSEARADCEGYYLIITSGSVTIPTRALSFGATNYKQCLDPSEGVSE